MAGMTQPGWKPPAEDPKKKETYAASIMQAGQDYDELMKRYRAMLDGQTDPGATSLVNAYKKEAEGGGDYNPTPTSYQQSPDAAGSMSNLADLSANGGYSQSGIADLRARGTSPIRAVYANAMQNITRQKALQGGYSPNYTAAMTKLARELSAQVGDATQNVNANIAQNVAGNRLGIAGTYQGATENQTQGMNQNSQFNAGRTDAAAINNAARRTGAVNSLAGVYGNQQQGKQQALSGMASLYGTTPALPALYGNQALGIAQLEEQKKTRKQAGSGALIQAYTANSRPSYGGYAGA